VGGEWAGGGVGVFKVWVLNIVSRAGGWGVLVGFWQGGWGGGTCGGFGVGEGKGGRGGLDGRGCGGCRRR